MSRILEALYNVLTSTKTTIVLFAILMLFFLVGNVLPYGGSYEQIKATGFVRNVIEGLDLLNVYSGPWFLTTVGLLFLNLGFCVYRRLLWMIRIRRPAELTPTTLSAHRATVKLPLPYSPEEVTRKVETFFRWRLFLKKSSRIRGEEVHSGGIYEQGFPHYVWLSLAYHLSIILAVVGATITFLFAFESELTIYPGEPAEVATVSQQTKWSKLMHSSENLIIPEEKRFKLGLKGFSIKYVPKPIVKDFPAKGFGPRLKETLSLGGLTVASPEDSYYPIEYSSHLVVYEKGIPQKEAIVKVNVPLRYRGLTLYQSAYDYKFDLYAGDDKLSPDEKGHYKLPGVEGEFATQQVVSGTLHLKDGKACTLKPFLRLTYSTPEGGEEKKPQVFKLFEREDKEIMGVKLRVENVRAGTVLSYRHDPGVPILWIAAPVLFFGMLFRAWGRWYRASYLVERAPSGSVLYFNLQRAGVWGDESRLIERLKNFVGASYSEEEARTH
ncbi:MAG TPA: cytochrome c biogenesis protein ResB [Candidatus Hypogeohydataceae bacterium YC38]